MFEVVVIILTLAGPLTVVLPTTYYDVDDRCQAAAKEALQHVHPAVKALSFCREREWTDS